MNDILEAINSSSSANEAKFEEGLYYVTRYGSSEAQYRYFVSHNKIEGAVRTAVSDNIDAKLFARTLFLPLVRNGEYEKVLEAMQNIDPSLSFWKDHVFHICDYCNAENHCDVLYKVQKWFGDHYRAAISCSKFYKRDCDNYADLLKNSEWLSQAICHLNSCNPSETRSAPPVQKPSIERYLRILHWQIRVTSIICSSPVTARMKFKRVPTLLGPPTDQIEVIRLLFLAMDTVDEAFLLCHEIVAKNGLEYGVAFGRAANTLLFATRFEETKRLVTLVEEGAPNADEVDLFLNTIIAVKPQSVEYFISRLNDPIKKIHSFVECDRLMSAYKCAIGLDKPAEMLGKIYRETVKRNCESVATLCKRRLELEGVSL